MIVSNVQIRHVIDSLPAEYNVLGVEEVDESLCNDSLVLSFHRNGSAIEQNHT